MRRIVFQTKTELEQRDPGSWMANNGGDKPRRVMGFLIKGAPEAIKEVIDACVEVVAEMSVCSQVNHLFPPANHSCR